MVPDENKLIGHANGTDTHGEGHLGRLINNTHVKSAAAEKHMANAETRRGHDLYSIRATPTSIVR